MGVLTDDDEEREGTTMSANIVEALSRRAAQSVTRRGSLLTLGGALTATVTGTAPVQAEKNKKKSKKKAKQKAAEQAENEANQVCANQVASCRAEVLRVCSLSGGKCLVAADCCSSLSVCNTTGFFSCIVAVSAADN